MNDANEHALAQTLEAAAEQISVMTVGGFTTHQLVAVLREFFGPLYHCTVCHGTGKAPIDGHQCVCRGSGSHADEVEHLRAMVEDARDVFGKILFALKQAGHPAGKITEIPGAIEKLVERAIEAEDSYVKLKRSSTKL